MTRAFIFICCLVAADVALSVAAEKFQLGDFQTRAGFELVVHKSRYLKPGTSKFTAQSAFVSLAHGLNPGKSDGLEVIFFEKPITESDLADLMNNDARVTRSSGRYAAMVLYLDKENRVSQVNLSFVVPGTGVARTVAWKPDELKRYFSQVSFTNGRLALKSNGSYSEAEPSQDVIKLSWNVDLNLPAKREVQR